MEVVRALIQHIPRPTWIYSLDTLRFLDVNPAAVAAYGWSRDDFLAMTLADIRPPEDVPALFARVAQLRNTPQGTSGPWRHRHKNGELVKVSLSFQSLDRTTRLIIVQTAPLPLSRREHQVFCLVASGHTSEEIGRQLTLSPKSVETYRARFMEKLSLRTRADIVRYALDHGMLV